VAHRQQEPASERSNDDQRPPRPHTQVVPARGNTKNPFCRTPTTPAHRSINFVHACGFSVAGDHWVKIKSIVPTTALRAVWLAPAETCYANRISQCRQRVWHEQAWPQDDWPHVRRRCSPANTTGTFKKFTAPVTGIGAKAAQNSGQAASFSRRFGIRERLVKVCGQTDASEERGAGSRGYEVLFLLPAPCS